MSASFPFTRGRLITHRVLVRHEFPAWPMMPVEAGARMTVVTPRTAEELGFEPSDIEPSMSILSATGSAPAALLRMRSVAVMGHEVEDLRVLCYPLPARLELDGILGLNFLDRFDIEISNSTERVGLGEQRFARSGRQQAPPNCGT